MRVQLQRHSCRLAAVSVLALLSITLVQAQTTSFSYQGRLTDGGAPANGNYDLQFALFDSVSGGTQIGSTQTISTVAVSAGIFTVQLDFGAGAFPGANRFLEISARLTGGTSFTQLAPRQPITSTPYAIRSLNASSADSVPVSGVPGGSGNYVQNTTSPQAASNFNISGNGIIGGNVGIGTQQADSRLTVLGTNLGACGPALIGWGSPVIRGCSSALAVTTSDVSRPLIEGINSSGTVFLVDGTGNVGVGASTPTAKLDIRVNSAIIRFSGVNCGSNFGAITFGNVALGCNNYSLLGEGVNTFINRPTGGAIFFRENNNDQMVIQSGGNVVFNGRGEFGGLLKLDQIDSGLGAGTTQLCRNAALMIATCTSSSLRYKKEIAPFSGGLSLIRRLRPISFTWKMDGSRDLGLGAEDVAKVEPLLVTHNDKGEIEGVRYDRLNVILINAVKQQQEQLERQNQQIDALKKLVCRSHRRASVCR